MSDPHAELAEGEGPAALQAAHTSGQKKGPPLPLIRQIMSGPRTDGGFPAAGEDRWRVIGEDIARGELGKRAIYLSGVTVSVPHAMLASTYSAGMELVKGPSRPSVDSEEVGALVRQGVERQAAIWGGCINPSVE